MYFCYTGYTKENSHYSNKRRNQIPIKETKNRHKNHLKAAQEWGNMWYNIVDSIHDSVNHELEKKYRTIDTKF